jgi:uncharacterized protein YdeI (BOF family)
LNMAKKIMMGVLFLTLVGALVAGAVNRTAAKSADTDNTEQRGAGWARAQEDGTALAANVAGRGATRQANQHEPLASQQGGGNQGAQSRGNGGQAQAGVAQSQPLELAATEDHLWESVSGAVLSIDDAQMTVQTSSGEIVIADRPWSFALEAGFTAQPGDQVTLRGFYENETFEVGQLTNGDQVIAIREESGRPLWAGGRGAGRGRTG